MAQAGTLMLTLFLAAGVATPALAKEPIASAARLVECGSESCLVITGNRADTAAKVSLNGHVVAAEGARRWRASVPVETVRAWAAPHARTLEVSVEGASQDVRLPIGLLGRAENLAMVIVRVK